MEGMNQLRDGNVPVILEFLTAVFKRLASVFVRMAVVFFNGDSGSFQYGENIF